MKKENDELINLFRSRLQHAEMPVRDNFWEQLEREIPVVQHNRKRLMMSRFAAAAAVLLILGGVSAAFLYLSPKQEIADAFTQVAVTSGSKGSIKNDGIIEEFPSIHASAVSPKPSVNNYKPVAEAMEEAMEESFSFSFSMSISMQEDRRKTNQTDQNSLAGGAETSPVYREEQQSTTTYTQPQKEKNRTWAVKLFALGNTGTGTETGNGLQMFSAKDNSLNINNAIGTVSQSDFASEEDFQNYVKVRDAIQADDHVTSVKHKLPVSVGLTVRKELSKRFALETGLVYTQLNSELTGGKESYYHQDQKLHYIGIPLKADVTLYDDKHFDLYAAAGGMVEKCVAGNVRTNYYVDGEKTHSSKSSLTPDPLQLSLSASLGVQYKISDRFAVYAEPGLAYYFDDGSQVSTIRKEKPLNFNLLCGVRMTY